MRALVQVSRAAIEDEKHQKALKAERLRIRNLRLQTGGLTVLVLVMAALAFYAFGLRSKESALRTEAAKFLRLGEGSYAQGDRLTALKEFD